MLNFLNFCDLVKISDFIVNCVGSILPKTLLLYCYLTHIKLRIVTDDINLNLKYMNKFTRFKSAKQLA